MDTELPDGFTTHVGSTGKTMYNCGVCGNRAMSDFKDHVKSAKHLKKVANRNEILKRRAERIQSHMGSAVGSTSQIQESPQLLQLPGPSLSQSPREPPLTQISTRVSLTSPCSRALSLERQSPGSFSSPRERSTLVSLNSPNLGQIRSRSSSVNMQSPGHCSTQDEGYSPQSVRKHGRSTSVEMQSPGRSSLPSNRPSSVGHSPRSLQNISCSSSCGMQSPGGELMPRERSASISCRDLYNMSPTAMEHNITSLEMGINETASSGSDTDSSDENIENLVEQVNEYDFGDNDEDWESVVDEVPSINNYGINRSLEPVAGQKNGWYPFGKLEEVISTMVYGSARNQLSRRQYETVRSAVSLAGLKLPTYKTLKTILKRIKKKLGLNLVSTTSPLNNKCYSLPLKELLRLDLAKPHVAQNLTFYPQVSKDGLVKEFSHCDKWLNGFPPHLRAPMVYTMFGHFYLYEPVQLASGELVVPTHFFYFGEDLVAKCLPLQLVNDHLQGGVARMEIFQEERVGLNDAGVVNISQFRNTFDHIILPGGYNLKALYGSTLYHPTMIDLHRQINYQHRQLFPGGA